LGDFFKLGGAPPDPRQEVSYTSFSAVSIRVDSAMEIGVNILPSLGGESYTYSPEGMTCLINDIIRHVIPPELHPASLFIEA
jgi:hypothetical protein